MQSLLTVKEVAELTGLSVSTLNKYRMKPGGPPFVRLGLRKVAYPLDCLRGWIDANKHTSTEEYAKRARG